MRYLLKILSGTLNGVEYNLAEGDSVFHIGSHRDLIDGTAAQMLGDAENAFFLPEDLPAAAFIVQVSDGADASPLLGERSTPEQPWQFRPLPTQVVVQVAGIYLAVCAKDERWAKEVLEFVVPAPTALPVPAEITPALMPPPPRKARPPRTLLWLGLCVMVVVSVGVTLLYWPPPSEARVRDLAGVLRDAPVDYQVLVGDDGKLYAFTDDAVGTAWGERASRRLQRNQDVYLLRRAEAARLEAVLEAAGIELVVVRLHDPQRPQIVLSGQLTDARREQVERVLTGHTAYAIQLDISGMDDAQLVAMAREDLHGLGISHRIDAFRQRVSVINDVVLDDAGLNAMKRMAERFYRQWGQRRITIHVQLWDDLLQGRSYQYSPGQLLSVGDGRWEYSNPASAESLNTH
jgi:hypothetical protein